MTNKQEQEAIVSLEKLDELTQDILKNNTDGGDANFRQIVFSGLTQTQNPILLDKMRELLLADNEEDLKKTIILGIFIHKEIFEPVIAYGEKEINMPYIDESYDSKESFLFILDALIELAYKNKLEQFETAIPLFVQIYKIACSAKSSSILADKLLQRILNSKVGTIKLLQQEFISIIEDDNSEINAVVIAIDILARANCSGVLSLIEDIFINLKDNKNLGKLLSLLDVSTLAFSYFTDKKYYKKLKSLLSLVKEIDTSNVENKDGMIDRINKRIAKLETV